MKNQLIQYTYFIGLTLLLVTCKSKEVNQAPPPTLTYFGETPRIQHPLSPEDSQKHIQLPDGFKAVLYAAEPNIINPIAFSWDESGRLWVVQSQDYPHELANDVGGDRITICEDTDGDGKADKFIDFATEQSLSTGITIVKGGAIVAQAPEMVFLEDTDGDDKMDKRTVLFDGFGTWDTHAGPSNLHYGPDNMIWGSVGYSGFQQSFNGQNIDFSMGVFRFSKDGQFFEPVGKFNNNTWGMGFSEDFEVFGSTANNNHACYVGIPLRYYDYLDKRPSWGVNSDFIQGHYEITPAKGAIPLQQVDVRGGYTAAAGANFYTAENYPKKYRNQMYVNAPTGHLVHIAKIVANGAGYQEEDGGNIFASTDAWTAPVFTETGPDGNLWVADWYNPVIQHNPDKRGMENQIWNDNKGAGNAHLNEHRDKKHGRIYILKHEDGQKSTIQKLIKEDSKGLLAGIESNNQFWRTTAQRLIVENNKTELIPDLLKIGVKNTKGAIHALWALDGLGALNPDDSTTETLLKKALNNTLLGIRKTAIALIPNTEKGSEMLLNTGLLEDENLPIRLAAMLKASELPETEALYQKMEMLTQQEQTNQDKWLKAASKIYFKAPNTETIEPEEYVSVIPSADEKASVWKYTTDKPSDNWFSLDFDDSSWQAGESGFGPTDDRPFLRTNWKSKDIWIRKTINLDAPFSTPVLKVLHDEDYEVYVNGEKIFEEKGWSPNYKYFRLDESGVPFQKGENSIAVHAKNENGDQYIDVGFGQVGAFLADRVITLNTVPQKMAYDKTVVHAMAGENLEIVLNNTDQMQHNLILIQLGSLDAFGKIVDKFQFSPTAKQMEYVPKSRYVLGATTMLDPEESGKIQLKIPNKPGDYPFVCTFPGHWQMMQGVLRVSPRGSYPATVVDAPKIAVMGGGGSHDFLKFFGVADGKIMNQNGANQIDYTESSLQLNQWLPAADALVISNNKAFDEATKQAIFNRVKQGMPMLIYHPSTWYNWKDWPIYNRELVGGGSNSHEKLQEFEVIVKKPNHPIMKGVPKRFRITDELYRWERDETGTPIEVLAIGKGVESGAEFPVVWVVKHKNAKIVGNTLGHDEDAHGLPAYQTILENSLNYILGKKPNL